MGTPPTFTPMWHSFADCKTSTSAARSATPWWRARLCVVRAVGDSGIGAVGAGAGAAKTTESVMQTMLVAKWLQVMVQSVETSIGHFDLPLPRGF